jgi:hypothetical protein
MATERSRQERSLARCDRRAPDTLVSGGTGFIGRWLLVELTRRDQTGGRPPPATGGTLRGVAGLGERAGWERRAARRRARGPRRRRARARRGDRRGLGRHPGRLQPRRALRVRAGRAPGSSGQRGCASVAPSSLSLFWRCLTTITSSALRSLVLAGLWPATGAPIGAVVGFETAWFWRGGRADRRQLGSPRIADPSALGGAGRMPVYDPRNCACVRGVGGSCCRELTRVVSRGHWMGRRPGRDGQPVPVPS